MSKKVANVLSESYNVGYEEGFRSGKCDAESGKPDRTERFSMSDSFEIGFKEGYEIAYKLTSLELEIVTD